MSSKRAADDLSLPDPKNALTKWDCDRYCHDDLVHLGILSDVGLLAKLTRPRILTCNSVTPNFMDHIPHLTTLECLILKNSSLLSLSYLTSLVNLEKLFLSSYSYPDVENVSFSSLTKLTQLQILQFGPLCNAFGAQSTIASAPNLHFNQLP